MSIGNRVRACRKAAHLSQNDLAVRIGATPTIVSRWERGTAAPGRESCVALAEVFGCSLDWLIRGEGNAPSAESAADLAPTGT